MLRLKTLGNAFVNGSSGEPLGGAAAQRRTIALLAALAVAGEGGLSRDKLVGLLWPEADPERARHSLTQALYAAKRALEAEDLFLVNADIRLNRDRITSDVQDLEAALESGDSERAVALYTGAFLDGFFLAGSPEFEHWSSLQRARLEARVTESLGRLADQAESQGDLRSSIEWRRRLTVIRPLDSGNALKLMKCLMDTGDRAGALQHAQLHEQMLREQLDLEPDPAVVALAAKLREPREQRLSIASSVPHPSPAVSPSPPWVASDLSLQEISTPGYRRRIGTWLREHRPQLLLAVLLLVAVLAGSLVLVRLRPSPTPQTTLLRQKVVVAPFRVLGATSSLAYLRDGMVELLSTRLADDTAARAMDAGAVLRALDDAGITNSATLPRDSIVKLAANLGAERVVIGSVIGTPRRMIVRASVTAVPSGAVHGQASVEGPADSISPLIDELAAKLLVSEAGEDERLASYTSASLRALRAYLSGQAALRQYHYVEAIRHYRRALEYDSGFALAALRLAVAADPLNQGEEKHQGIGLAWTSREVLSERDLTVLAAFAGSRYPMPSPVREHLTALRRLVDQAPDNAESWYMYGAHVFHEGALVGVAEPEEQSIALLRRALTIDQDYLPANLLLTHLLTRNERPESPLRTETEANSANPFAVYMRWRHIVATKDSTAQQRFRSTMRGARPANLRMIAMASQFDGKDLAGGALALSILQSRPRSLPEQVDLVLGQHSLALLKGRPQAALEASTQLAALQPASQGYLRMRVLDALYAEGDTTVATAAARRLETLTTGGIAGAANTSEPHQSNICTLAQWRLSRGDTTGINSAIEALRGFEQARGPTSSLTASPAVCGRLVEVWMAVLAKRRDAFTKLEQLDSLVLTPAVAGDAIAFAPLLMADLFERLGQPSRALQAIRRRVYMFGWPRYLGTAWRREGRLAELSGDVAGALEAYDRYLGLRASPERSLNPQLEQVRNLRAALRPADAPQAGE